MFLIMQRRVHSVKPFDFVEFGDPLAATYLQTGAVGDDARLHTCTTWVVLG
ncbi:hypothetical protein AB0L14_25310 [Streptomyces sp. NPDC052727]|uniref:hypothetical protein n=1 Tax=Streptomyces sp. NPDC052727 TaxID=3154854 RepID=UPI00341761AA